MTESIFVVKRVLHGVTNVDSPGGVNTPSQVVQDVLLNKVLEVGSLAGPPGRPVRHWVLPCVCNYSCYSIVLPQAPLVTCAAKYLKQPKLI